MLLYQFGIAFYGILIRFFSIFNTKAKLWCEGRSNIFYELEKINFHIHKQIVWFHCASLGEFEQARPLIEKIKLLHNDSKILITFFSPSGYEIRKNYALAEWVFYLPLDTRYNSKRFVQIIKPKMVFFVKYEFWYNYIHQLFVAKIPVYSVSAIFRKNQYYFNFISNILPNSLLLFSHIFVQNIVSQNLLKSIHIDATICGDTRFDRVFEIAKYKKEKPEIVQFKSHKKLLVIGSAWIEDLKIIFNDKNTILTNIKIIIAPHEIDTKNLQMLASLLPKSIGYYSKSEFDKDVLILDNIGMLNDIYAYSDVAYIGGAFGKGLHNILEAATHGVPVIFGPNYIKFQEAIDLEVLKGAFSVTDSTTLNTILLHLLTNNDVRIEAGKICKNYVKSNIGAVDKIYQNIKINL